MILINIVCVLIGILIGKWLFEDLTPKYTQEFLDTVEQIEENLNVHRTKSKDIPRIKNTKKIRSI